MSERLLTIGGWRAAPASPPRPCAAGRSSGCCPRRPRRR